MTSPGWLHTWVESDVDDITTRNLNVTPIETKFNGNIIDSDIKSDANIAVTKLAKGNASDILHTKADGSAIEWAASTAIVVGTANDLTTTSIGDAAGDTIYRDSATTFERLAKGTSAQLYMMNSGATAPNWVSMSGDTTIAATGAVTIGSKKVDYSKMTISNRGYLIRGAATLATEEFQANQTGYIVAGNGTDVVSVQMSGDVSIGATGVAAIGTGVIVAGDISANTIPWSKMQLQGGNGACLVSNQHFMHQTAGTSVAPDNWGFQSGYGTFGTDGIFDTTTVLAGSTSIKFPNTATTPLVFGHPATAGATTLIPVVPNGYYRLLGWVRADANNNPNNRIGILVQWYTSAGAYISSSWDNGSGSSPVTTINTWEQRSRIVQSPATGAFARLVFWKDSGTTFNAWLSFCALYDATSSYDIAGTTRGRLFRTDATNQCSELSANGAGDVVCGDGTDVRSITMSGDATIASGVLTVGSKKITAAKMYGATRGALFYVSDASNTVAELDCHANGTIPVGDGTNLTAKAVGTSAQVFMCNATPTPTWTTLSGDVTVGATGTTAIGNDKVSAAMMKSTAGGGAGIIFKGSNTANDISELNVAIGSLVIGTTNDVTTLAKGTANQLLAVKADASTLEYINPSAVAAGTATDIVTTAAGDAVGDLIYRDAATTFTRLAIGTAGQILQCGAGTPPTAPQWSTISGDASIAVGGALTIANDVVSAAKMSSAGGSGGTIFKSTNTANAVSELAIAVGAIPIGITNDVSTLAVGSSAQLLLCNATPSPTWTSMSGDVTIGNTGVTAIGTGKVTSSMISDGTIVNADLAIRSFSFNRLIQASSSGNAFNNNFDFQDQADGSSAAPDNWSTDRTWDSHIQYMSNDGTYNKHGSVAIKLRGVDGTTCNFFNRGNPTISANRLVPVAAGETYYVTGYVYASSVAAGCLFDIFVDFFDNAATPAYVSSSWVSGTAGGTVLPAANTWYEWSAIVTVPASCYFASLGVRKTTTGGTNFSGYISAPKFIKQSRSFFAYPSADIDPYTSGTAIVFNTDGTAPAHDYGSVFDTTTGAFTAPCTGIWQFCAQVDLHASGTISTTDVQLWRSTGGGAAAAYIQGSEAHNVGNSDISLTLTCVIPVLRGDVFTIRLNHTGGGGPHIVGSTGPICTYFSGHEVR